jgi:hypothetical protein
MRKDESLRTLSEADIEALAEALLPILAPAVAAEVVRQLRAAERTPEGEVPLEEQVRIKKLVTEALAGRKAK